MSCILHAFFAAKFYFGENFIDQKRNDLLRNEFVHQESFFRIEQKETSRLVPFFLFSNYNDDNSNGRKGASNLYTVLKADKPADNLFRRLLNSFGRVIEEGRDAGL